MNENSLSAVAVSQGPNDRIFQDFSAGVGGLAIVVFFFLLCLVGARLIINADEIAL